MARKGKAFNLTEDRLELVKSLLRKQYSVTYAADRLGIALSTLSEKLSELGIDTRQLKREGINTFKADTFAMVSEIEDPKDQVKARMDLLKHYDTSDDVAGRQSNEVQGSATTTVIQIIEDKNESI